MILSVSLDGKDILNNIEKREISYVKISGYIYGIPLQFEIGVIESITDTSKLVIGREYNLYTMENKEITMTLSDVHSDKETIKCQTSTLFIFMPKEYYNLTHNKYLPTLSIFGCSLERHIIGDTNQLNIFLFELRKKGLIIAYSPSFKLIKVHTLDYKNDLEDFLRDIVTIKKIKSKPIRRNYLSITSRNLAKNESITQTQNGVGVGIVIPNLEQGSISALDSFVSPQYKVHTTGYDPNLTLGKAITLYGEKYVVMEIQQINLKSGIQNFVTLGKVLR